MSTTLFRTDKELKEIYDRNFSSIYRISYMYMKNKFDAEDIVQNVFIKLIEKNKQFENFDHEKAWLIITTINTCKNHFKTWWNRNITFEEIEKASYDKSDELLEFILNIPEKYKEIIFLYYYEGYSTKEISELLKKKESTVRSLLKRSRDLLKEILKEEIV